MVVRLYEIKGGLSFLVTPYGQYLNYPFVIFFLKKKQRWKMGVPSTYIRVESKYRMPL